MGHGDLFGYELKTNHLDSPSDDILDTVEIGCRSYLPDEAHAAQNGFDKSC